MASPTPTSSSCGKSLQGGGDVGNSRWSSLPVSPEPTVAFRCDTGLPAAGGRSRGLRATPPRVLVAVLSHTGSHTVSPRAARNPFTRAHTCKVPYARASRGPAAAVAAPVTPPHACCAAPGAPHTGARPPLLPSSALSRRSPDPSSALGYPRLAGWGRGLHTDERAAPLCAAAAARPRPPRSCGRSRLEIPRSLRAAARAPRRQGHLGPPPR